MAASTSEQRANSGPLSARGLQGHLHLVCGPDSRGRTAINDQSFRAPMHISKPYWDGSVLLVNIINPTAGLLSGDAIDCEVHVEAGAHVLLSTPSANRAHRMLSGRATVDQRFTVGPSASLENWPEIFIPQSGTRYAQRTRIAVADGGELMFWELLAPGRVASGESFAYLELDWTTHLFLADRLILRERFKLVPGEPSVEAWRARFPQGYYASGFVISPGLPTEARVWRQIHDLHRDDDCWIGCSALAAGGSSIRVLCRDSVTFRHTLQEIRKLLYAALERTPPALRRIG